MPEKDREEKGREGEEKGRKGEEKGRERQEKGREGGGKGVRIVTTSVHCYPIFARHNKNITYMYIHNLHVQSCKMFRCSAPGKFLESGVQ